MRFNYYIHLLDSNGYPFVVSNSNVSKTRLHKVIDFYNKSYFIEQLLIKPSNIQYPRPVGDETDNKKE